MKLKYFEKGDTFMLKKGDILLFALALIAIIAGYGVLRNSGRVNDTTANIAIIKQNNKVIKRINLSTINDEQRITIDGKYYNTILFEKGKIRFEDASCPDKLCVKTGWLTRKGETAVCLPNQTIITVEGHLEDVDGVTY